MRRVAGPIMGFADIIWVAVRYIPIVCDIIAITFGVGSLVAALRAGRLWYQSSKVRIEPGWNLEARGVMQWVASAMTAFHQASRLNQRAAIWTGVAAFSAALSAFAGVLPGIITRFF
jgi:hypothetical protein